MALIIAIRAAQLHKKWYGEKTVQGIQDCYRIQAPKLGEWNANSTEGDWKGREEL